MLEDELEGLAFLTPLSSASYITKEKLRVTHIFVSFIFLVFLAVVFMKVFVVRQNIKACLVIYFIFS